MFKVGDQVKINPMMECGAIKQVLTITIKVGEKQEKKCFFDSIFTVTKIGKAENSKTRSRKFTSLKLQKYWVTIEFPNGIKKRISSMWLVKA